jgi:hypothetical protein
MNQEERPFLSRKGANAETSPASPVPGLNDNLEFMGRQLHVQTESAGFPTARIVTQVFCRGRVMFSRKSEYPPGINESNNSDKIRELMHSQHCEVIQEIRNKQTQILKAH